MRPATEVGSVAHLPVEALVVDPLTLRIADANREACRLFARPALVGLNLPSLVPELDRSQLLGLLDGRRLTVRFRDRRDRGRCADVRARLLSSGNALVTVSDTTTHERTEASLRRAFLTQKTLSDLLRKTLDDRPLPAQLEDVLDLLLELPWCPFGPRGAVLLEEGGELYPAALRGGPVAGELARLERPASGDQVVVDASEPSVTSNFFATSPLDPPMIEVPLEVGDAHLGVLVLQSSSADSVDPFELDFLRVVARHVAQVVSHVRAREAACEQAESTRIIVERAINAIVSTDEDGRITTFNPAAEAMFGWSAREVIGEDIAILMPPATAAVHHLKLQRYRASGLTRVIGVPRELIAARRDGSTFPILLEISETPRDGHLAFTAFIRDETERRRVQQELVAAREAAIEASQTKSRFLANMSHEIRTPMNGVIGMTEMLLEGELTPDQRDAVETIQSSGEALLSVINDILDFSRIEAGRLTVEPVPFRSRRLVSDVVRLLRAKAEEKGIALEYEVDPSLPARLMGDAGRLRQILVNLLGNAVKFTEEGRATLIVERGPGHETRFIVKDTGVGISPEGLRKLFQPFVQADGSITRRFGGTGLGLTISKQLAELMDGELTAESVEGEGSTFTLRLPLVETAGPLEDPTVDLPSLSDAGLRILLVEDNPVNQKVATRMLEALGAVVTVAGDGACALEKLEADPGFDLVVMDCQMPIMDGYEATREIRRRGSNLPVVALTANAMKGDEERCREAGMTDFLSKPVRRGDFERVLARVLGPRTDG